MLELLKKIRCFSNLDEEVLLVVQKKFRSLSFKAGERLCTEGEVGDRMFIIETGEVAVLKSTENGDLIEVAKLHHSDIAGEMGLFGQKVRSATLQACNECKVWVLDYAVFEELLDRHGSIAKELLSYICKHLVRQTSIVAKLINRDMGKGLRVAFFHATPYRNELYRQKNSYNYLMRFFTPRLSLETVALAAGFHVIVVSANDCLDKAVIDELHALGVEMIALRCAGFNNVDIAACERNGISVVRVPAYSPYAVAEHAIALIMTLNRHIHRAHNRVRDGNFSLDGLLGFDMNGRTAGVIGSGKIGTCLMNILNGFGCRILVYSRSPKQDLINRLGVRYVELDELFAESDILSLHIPLTPETHYLINPKAVAKMKPGVMLINTSRGGLIDTMALLDGLKSGRIGYAGLDVYEEEESYFFEDFSNRVLMDDMLARLTTFNNVIITSHQGSLTDVAQGNIVNTTLENIQEYEVGKRGSELTNAVATRALS